MGGQDVDNRLVQFFANEFQKKNQLDCTQNAKALRKLKEKAQEAKHILSLNLKVLHQQRKGDTKTKEKEKE